MSFYTMFKKLRLKSLIGEVSASIFSISIVAVCFINLYEVLLRFTSFAIILSSLLTVLLAIFLCKPFKDFYLSNFNSTYNIKSYDVYSNYLSLNSRKLNSFSSGIIISLILYVSLSFFLYNETSKDVTYTIDTLLLLFIFSPLLLAALNFYKSESFALSFTLSEMDSSLNYDDAKNFIIPLSNHLNLVNKFLETLRINKFERLMLETFIEFKTKNITLKSRAIARFLNVDNFYLFNNLKVLGYFSSNELPDLETYGFALDNYYELGDNELMFSVFKDLYNQDKSLIEVLLNEETDLSFKRLIESFILQIEMKKNLGRNKKVIKV